MPPGRPPGRFFLRASGLLILLLVIWWFFLLQPMLFLLHASAETCGGMVFGADSHELVTVTASGDWSFRVPLDLVVRDLNGQPGAAQVHSIDFDIPRSDVIAFTFGLPVFWAIILAAPGIRRSLPPLLFGTLLMAILEIVLLLVFVEISARKVALQLAQSQNGMAKWFLHFAEYLLVSIIPYLAPFVIALSVHRELRSQVLGRPEDAALPAAKRANLRGNVRPSSKKRRTPINT